MSKATPEGLCGSCRETVPVWLADHAAADGAPCLGSGCLPSSYPAEPARLRAAGAALAEGDVVAMVRAYEALKGWTT